MFGTILNDSVQDELIMYSPISKSESLLPHIYKDIEPFSLQEIDKILSSCDGQNYNIIATLLFTGMRTGECIGLKWSDINFEARTIFIQRTIGRGREGLPKTRASIRTIDILDTLLLSLESQYKLTGAKNSYVFLNQIGNHYFDSSKLRDKMWKKTLEKAGVRYRTIYQTRHTYCSLLLQSNEDILWISKTLGHSTVKTTLEKYAKYMPREVKLTSVFDTLSK